MNWSSLLDFPGFFAALGITLLIVVPVFLRSLKQQNVRMDRERDEADAARPDVPTIPVECRVCGQVNRVPETAPRALCGRCRTALDVRA